MTENILIKSVKYHRDVYSYQKLFDHSGLRQWEREKRDIREEAKKEAIERIKNHNFKLDQHRKKELDTIYKKACKEFS